MSARYYYSVDEQGSTDFIIDRSGKVKNEYWYDAFGNVLESKQEVHNRITYTGQQFDSITQQYYLRARFYNPVIGRFSQEDIYRGDGLNLYAYCGNNPVVYWDPSGYSGNSGKCKSKTSSIYTNEDGKTFKKDKNGRWHSADGKYAGNVTGDTSKGKNKKTSTDTLQKNWENYTNKKHSGEIHHGLPEEFKKWFKSRGINVNNPKYYFDLPVDKHRLKEGKGIHTNNSPLGREWNRIWEDYIKKNPNASKEQIEKHLNKMATKAHIEIYRATVIKRK